MSLENFMSKPVGRGGGGGGFLNFQKWGDYPKWGGLFLKWGVLTPLRTMPTPSSTLSPQLILLPSINTISTINTIIGHVHEELVTFLRNVANPVSVKLLSIS